MPAYEWYVTPVNRSGTSTAESEVVTVFVGTVNPGGYDVFIFDENNDGLIDQKEWQNFTGGGLGLNGASEDILFDGKPGGSGFIYSTTSIPIGTTGLTEGLDKDFNLDPRDLNIAPPPCFTFGTLISTKVGRTPIERLTDGDFVLSTDDRELIVRKVFRRKITAKALALNPKLYPVRITAGALGDFLPERDLVVSRQHRMLVRSKIAKRMFGCSEILLPAIRLIGLPGIFIDTTVDQVEYFHLLFDKHEIIYAEGAPSESLLIGPEAINALDPEAREEICTIFPEITKAGYALKYARLIPSAHLQKQFVARHLKNTKPLLGQ